MSSIVEAFSFVSSGSKFSPEYKNSIYKNLKKSEDCMLQVDTPIIQDEIDKEYRRSRFEAMVTICQKAKATNDTLFLAMAIIDHFLLRRKVLASEFIFVVISAIRLAWKMEEVDVEPNRSEFHSKVDAIGDMEEEILKTLKWKLMIPHALSFIGIFNVMEDIQYKYHILSIYIAEVATTHMNPKECPPSMIAAASVYIARKIANLTPWTQTLAMESRIEESQVIPWAILINHIMKTQVITSTAMTSPKKYADEKYYNVSSLRFPVINPEAQGTQTWIF